jgi:large subunit ribosomal protein L15
MKEHNLPSGANRGKKRLGRGEGNGHGKTCCRGHKGAGARSGYSLRAGFEGGQMPLYRKLPQRGFNRSRFQTDIAVINVGQLVKLSTDEVSLQTLKDAGLIRSNAKLLKLLGSGEIDKVFHVKANYASSSASKKIEAAGGSVSLA